MKPQAIEELSIVELEWIDSSHIPGWQYEQDYAFVPGIQFSVGWVIANTPKGEHAALVITTTVGRPDSRAKFGGAHTPFSIPWCSILKCKVLKKAKL